MTEPKPHPLIVHLTGVRKQLRLTQTELAHEAGVSRSAVCEMEKGYHDPRLSTLLGYASGLGFRLIDMATLGRILNDHRWMPEPWPTCLCRWKAKEPGQTHALHVLALVEDAYRQIVEPTAAVLPAE